MIIAGLDTATKTGVAVGPIGGRPELWTLNTKVKCEAEFHATRFEKILGLAHSLVSDFGVTHIAIEKPFGAKHNNFETNLLLFGLPAIVLGWAARKKVSFELIPPQTAAKHFIGSGKLASAERKAAILAECRTRGWEPADDNQADAAAVWDLACTRLSNTHAAATGPLFHGAKREGANQCPPT